MKTSILGNIFLLLLFIWCSFFFLRILVVTWGRGGWLNLGWRGRLSYCNILSLNFSFPIRSAISGKMDPFCYYENWWLVWWHDVYYKYDDICILRNWFCLNRKKRSWLRHGKDVVISPVSNSFVFFYWNEAKYFVVIVMVYMAWLCLMQYITGLEYWDQFD